MTLTSTSVSDSPAQKAPNEVEPRVLTADVQRILRGVVRPDNDDYGDSVVLIADRADTSTRTVYRALSASSHTMSLDLADRLCLAADAHLSECRLVWPDGSIQNYLD